MKNIPQLRFAGFEGEWEEKKFGKVIQRKSKSSANNSLPRVEYEDIIPEIGKLNKDINSKSSIKKGIYFESDDVLFGKLRPYLKNYLNPQFEGIAVGDFWILNNKSGDNSFLFYYLQIPQFQYIANTSIGTKMPRSDWNLVSGSKFIYPSNNEQEKIGDLFRKIDALIEKQEGKVSKMEDFKKSMLQKMFPKKGELVPEFRFDGFDGDWKKRKFRDIYKTYESGNRLPKSLLKEGSIPYVLAKTTNNGIHMRIDKDTLDYSGNPMKLFKPNSITFSIDNPEAVFIQNEPFYTSNIMRVFYNENHTRTQTIFYKLQFEKNTRGFDWGIKFSGPVALDSKLFVPFKNNEIDVTEIEKIGQFFKNLDTQIETEEKLLESYKQMKKSLLQKMFV